MNTFFRTRFLDSIAVCGAAFRLGGKSYAQHITETIFEFLL